MADFDGFPVIDDSTGTDTTHPMGFGRGLVPRDYSECPEEMFDPPSQMQLIPRSEWDARIQEQNDTESSLWHLRMRGKSGAMVPSLNQGQWGYCWAHSTTHTVMLARMVANQPYVPLSAFAVAAIIKDGRDEGGWCGLSADFARKTGIPSQALWPQGSVDLIQNTPAMKADAARHKITEDWVDLTRQAWDQDLTFDQLATCLLMNVPCAVDFNWWSHSVCGIQLVRIEAGSYGIKIWNSWGDAWGQSGCGILQGKRAVPDGAIGTRVTTPS